MGVDIELAALGAKLRGGGDVFHRSCAILSFACVGSKRCRGHVMDQLKLQGSGISGELVFSVKPVRVWPRVSYSNCFLS